MAGDAVPPTPTLTGDALGAQPDGTVRLSGMLAEEGVARDALDRARLVAARTDEPLPRVLTRLGILSEARLAELLSQALGLPLLRADELPKEALFPGELSSAYLKRAGVLPVSDDGGGVVLAMANPFDEYAIRSMSKALDRGISPAVALTSDLDMAWEKLYGQQQAEQNGPNAVGEDAASQDDVERLRDAASEAPIVRLVNRVLTQGVEARASDIHLEPTEDCLNIRFRVDGLLRMAETQPPIMAAAITSRVKIMARLDIAERRLPQDGRLKLTVRGREIDFRVATGPSLHGEGIVLRILDRAQLPLDFAALGFDSELQVRLMGLLRQPHGVVLITGPTGSGKTTTLYAGLNALNCQTKKIVTIEDPIEYQLTGIIQTEVQSEIGRTFASALRFFLRHNPNIIMVGEIRDRETAEMALSAAQTGHLVLSTLHTNDAPSAVGRLLDMGVEDFHLASVVNGIAAQRLVRTLCPNCRPPVRGASGINRYEHGGCEGCGGTGFKGRTSIVEVLAMSDALRDAVRSRRDAKEIRRLALGEGMVGMREHGMRKVAAGLTTESEVMRATADT